MVLWVLAMLLSPAPSGGPVQLALGLAVVVAALLILLAAALSVPAPAERIARPRAHRNGEDARPRLFDPAAPGRPRPRAPSADPAAV